MIVEVTDDALVSLAKALLEQARLDLERTGMLVSRAVLLRAGRQPEAARAAGDPRSITQWLLACPSLDAALVAVTATAIHRVGEPSAPAVALRIERTDGLLNVTIAPVVDRGFGEPRTYMPPDRWIVEPAREALQ